MVDNLTATVTATSEEFYRAPSPLAFIASHKRGTLGMLLEEVLYPEASLLKTYV